MLGFKPSLRAFTTALVPLLALPIVAAGQEPTPPIRTPAPSETRLWVNGQEVPSEQLGWYMPRRARLGVSVNMRAKETDSIGAYLLSVTPNGPASKAGLRSGDIIVRLDGKGLTGGGSNTNPDQSVPGLKLIELAAKLPPNDTVAVEYRRGTDRRTTQLVTGDEASYTIRMKEEDMPMGAGEMARVRPDMFNRTPDHMGELRFGTAFTFVPDLADLELAPVNADLGRYFGVTDGVLVIDVPEDSRLNLKGGDVVLTVDGRESENPAHLLRILQSYEQGEEIKFEIMRMKKKEVVTGRVGRGEPRPNPGQPR